MQVENPWIGYLNRSYASIKQNLLERLGIAAPEVTDHSESNILIIIISIFAGLMEQLNYYIDNLAREAFIGQARRYSSMVSLVKLIDYRIKAKVPATVDVRMEWKFDGDTALMLGDTTMGPGNTFATANSIPFIAVEPVSLQEGDPAIWILPCKQQQTVEDYNLGNTNGSAGQVFPLPSDYAHGSGLVLINGEYWEERPTFGRSTAEDKHYIVDVSADQIPYIKFGDNVNGLIPTSGQAVVLSYSATQGAEGNVDPNTIIVNTLIDWADLAWVDEVVITNPIKASGGADVEPIERIRENAPRSLRTLDRAVSKQDYIDVSMLAPGVRFADVFWDCGKTIDIYIAPNDGGIASLALLADTKAFVDLRKMYTTTIRVSPSGETALVIQLDVTANPYVDAPTCKAQVENAMVGEYEFEKSQVNRKIRLSDIYALVDNLVTVDFLNISVLTTNPYARPLYSLTQLDADITTLPASSTKIHWRIAYDGSAFRLFKNGAFITQIYIGVLYTDTANVMTVLLNAGVYNAGDEWEFYTYPYTEDIELDDYSVPILELANLTVNVTEQP